MFAAVISPTGLFIAGTALLTILATLFASSIIFYWRAKDLAPTILRIQDLQKKIFMEEGRLEEVRGEIAARVTELTKAERVIAEGRNEQVWLDANRTKLETLRSEVAALQVRVDEEASRLMRRQEEVTACEKELKSIRDAQHAAEKNRKEIDIELVAKEKIKATLEDEVRGLSSLKKEVEILRLEKGELDLAVKEQHKKFGEADDALRKKKVEIETAQALLGQADAAKRVLAELDKTRDMNVDRWKDLDRPVVESPIVPATSAIQEKDWLDAFENALKNAGFLFNPRAIRAFHAAMKCAETSPLVVLAGISGTGKSLLPELYAAAGGMNFLPVAVQPRWDGPQDLFGFYNYMEGRYKATELSRLLWQFDKYNNPKAKALYAKQIPMSLVLLDEMNLARVEYYFSDLLSKLEIRTGLNAESDLSRRKAEIELECNAMAKAEQSRRLFVGLNTLFIGTMNEDESTQTLSDKVLDRANVIRFGQPGKLAESPKKDRLLSAYEGSPTIISHKNWQSWCTGTLSPTNRRNLRQTVTELNDAMSAVGRPFGHRVNLAIERYIAVYPGPYNEALSDQIEMKILPKLNGLDGQATGFQEVKSKLKGVIDGLHDDALTRAFDLSCEDASASFFKWRGVMR
jgi:hypothetical protein